ncbi:hypothetical protein YC2023_042829 [Brassica napus]
MGMNGDRGMMGNNAFPNVPIKNHHSQGIIIPSHSLSFLMINFNQWLVLVVCSLAILKAEGLLVNITFVRNAVAKGAVCLDGSPPAYHLDRGSGTGINSWLIQLEDFENHMDTYDILKVESYE